MSFKAAPEDFPQKHKATILNIGIAETGTEPRNNCLKVFGYSIVYQVVTQLTQLRLFLSAGKTPESV